MERMRKHAEKRKKKNAFLAREKQNNAVANARFRLTFSRGKREGRRKNKMKIKPPMLFGWGSQNILKGGLQFRCLEYGGGKEK